ncbi:penicillin acylase family protein [Zobellia alginiliquefaciens]|uniref:penicillin acylase family protein n=1 Tax=Zobellia alginiliquefaciens TaxID=3032586 RepID=UPI0023E45138|nr:penicillin acylase family protein [Zobellia alginiliquefaciens]
MRRFKQLGLGFLALIGVLAVIIGSFTFHLKPDYDGETKLQGLSEEVQVYYDTYGIPHIYAENDQDAFKALGYVHAQDRLWQMELLRRIGSGRLAEVFGKDLLETDKFFLALGVDDYSSETIAKVNSNDESVQLSLAYLDGINQFIEEGPTPVEFYLTGTEKKPFVLKDVYNTLGYMAFSFAMAHKTDPLLSRVKDKLGFEYLKDLEIDSDTTTLWIKNYPRNRADSIQKSISEVMSSLEKLSIPLFEGSNGWAIAPEKTKNGKVIFANDPHIGFSQPSVWYEAHVSTPNYEKYGYHLAGVPYPILGHNRQLAYGMTMFENDDVDFYYEKTHPTDPRKYKKGNEWKDYEIISKTIKVKDSDDVHFSYKKTHRGPVLNGIADQITGERPISMWWIFTKVENELLNALYDMSYAANLNEFALALKQLHAPGLGIVYGDAEDNVAYWAAAKLYHIPDSVHTKFVNEEGKGLPVEKRYLDFGKNPHTINPSWHYVYSANNQPESIDGMLYPGYYLPENRARRIFQLLESKSDWDKEAVGQMINDDTSPVNVEIVTMLLSKLKIEGLGASRIKILDALKQWNGDYPKTSIEATVYHKWLYSILQHTFEDELGDTLFDEIMNTHLIKRTIAPIVANENSIWWDDISTSGIVESQADIINVSFRETLQDLEKTLGKDSASWVWGRVHTIEHGHPIGQIDALRSFFNVGPFGARGTREVINNAYFPYTEDGFYKVSSGPSTRRVIDFSDVENGMSILPTGQSGNPFSEHYKDQAEMYVNGGFRKMMLNKEEIMTTSKSQLTLKPDK